MNKTIKYIITLMISFVVATIVTLLFFGLKLFSNIPVYMYRGLLYIIIVAIILFVVLLILAMKKNVLEVKDVISIVLVYICVHVAFFVIVPVTIDRSQSVYILSHFANTPLQTLTKYEVEDNFIKVYIKDREAIEKRFEEQIATGSLEKVADDTYVLTKRGQLIVDAFKMIGSIYGVDMKNMTDE